MLRIIHQMIQVHKERTKAANLAQRVIDTYKTSTPKQRREIEQLFWEQGRMKGDIAWAERIVKHLRRFNP